MEYVARFEVIKGHRFRFDTRIYLESFDPKANGMCVGAIIGKNPGSAVSRELNQLLPLELNGDKMLPTVGNRFLEGYRRVKKPIPPNAFVQVWNLFYVCDPDLGEALGKALKVASELSSLPVCSSEKDAVAVVWYGWGDNDPTLNPYKSRFLGKKYKNQFFYNPHSRAIVQWAPAVSEFAKHTQGMPSEPVTQYLATVL